MATTSLEGFSLLRLALYSGQIVLRHADPFSPSHIITKRASGYFLFSLTIVIRMPWIAPVGLPSEVYKRLLAKPKRKIAFLASSRSKVILSKVISNSDLSPSLLQHQ